MIDSGSFVYILTIGIKAKDPPWFANLTGSVADSVAAKVRLLFELCKSLGRKVRILRVILTVVGCLDVQSAAFTNQSGASTSLIGECEWMMLTVDKQR